MDITVIGAGVVGVTTAHALARRGHRVTVIERLSGPAEETSRANAGQRSYGVVYPWAVPGLARKALFWLLERDGPLKMTWPPSLETLRFLFATLRYANAPGVYGLNRRAMLRLGEYSRQCFHDLESAHDLTFDGEHDGLMHLASTPEAMTEYLATSELLSELGIAHRLLGPEDVRAREPGMTGSGPLFGALRFETDGTGDCHGFTRALAASAESLGVTFRYGTTVTALEGDHRQIRGVRVSEEGGGDEVLDCDAVVLCAGAASPKLARSVGLFLPIYPVKGYSLTVPMDHPERGPYSTIHDDRYKVVSTRLGDRLRATGFVALSGFDRRIPEARLETIRRSVASRFPGAADMSAATPWTGFRPMTPDGPAIIGRGTRDNLYLNTGHGTFGWTFSAGSAELISQVIDGESPALNLDPFRPGRFAE
ncbi:glycine/D-amino acid oxidase-like deaminating enzyme [Tamilnaduibacter salinus]|uniref:Glycine/D-amino acid oxidase-like deaminating enzyme n=1 Tax=Tamilnaduibacter salinus TaxID=1484056 RepID=A0A2U1CWI7_9GAMM|nr:D-amino acid dehydrogenase [Tamilnaduibacter salinus]PVY76326.1 glycine/D-amino acid oxidase-like deaminating enzyme [Tamilnaduibacter salinus]